MTKPVFDIFDASGQQVFSLADLLAGNVTTFSTGKSNGSFTMSVSAGELVEFAYNVLTQSPPSSGTPSPFPQITISDATISWSFDASGSSTNTSIDITGFKY